MITVISVRLALKTVFGYICLAGAVRGVNTFMRRLIPVLIAILMVLLSVSQAGTAFPDPSPSPADPAEGSRLVGLFVTMEDISPFLGEEGLLWASVSGEDSDSGPEFRFDEVNGLRLLCFTVPGNSDEGDAIVSNVDDGFTAVDFNLSEDNSSIRMKASVSVVPKQDEEAFFCNPVLRTADGRIYAVPGDFMVISAEMNPPGASVGQTVRDERKHSENGTETIDVTEVNVEIVSVREPLKIRLLQFGKAHEILQNEEFIPGSVPERIVPSADADYLLLETEEKAPDGSAFTRREIFGRDTDYLNTLSCREDGICLPHYHEIFWN